MENPPQLTVGRLLTSWQLDVPALLVVVILGALYGWGVLRLRRRGERWPCRASAPSRCSAWAP